jgi:hypothetical protein
MHRHVHDIAGSTIPFLQSLGFRSTGLPQNQKCESRAVFDTARLTIGAPELI